jgi:hypothetical protein
MKNWYKQSWAGKQHIAVQIALWVVYGFFWIPALYFWQTSPRTKLTKSVVIGIFFVGFCVACHRMDPDQNQVTTIETTEAETTTELTYAEKVVKNEE